MSHPSKDDFEQTLQIAGFAAERLENRRQFALLSRSPQFLGGELKKTADETLFLELALRGYDLSKLRDEPTTAEIVKIG